MTSGGNNLLAQNNNADSQRSGEGTFLICNSALCFDPQQSHWIEKRSHYIGGFSVSTEQEWRRRRNGAEGEAVQRLDRGGDGWMTSSQLIRRRPNEMDDRGLLSVGDGEDSISISWRKSQKYILPVNKKRYDTRCYFNVRSKADMSRLNLPHADDN